MLFVAPATMLNVPDGENVTFTVTVAWRLSEAKPMAERVDLRRVPTPTAVICGLAAGTCEFAGMRTLGVTVTTLVLVLVKLTVTPLGGATVDRFMGRLAVWPRPSAGSAPRLTTLLVIVTPTLPGPNPGAVAVDRRGAHPRSGDREGHGRLSLRDRHGAGGEVHRRPVGLVANVTVTPPAGAGVGIAAAPLIVRPSPTSGPSVVSAMPEMGLTVAVALSLAALLSTGVEAVRVAVLA